MKSFGLGNNHLTEYGIPDVGDRLYNQAKAREQMVSKKKLDLDK